MISYPFVRHIPFWHGLFLHGSSCCEVTPAGSIEQVRATDRNTAATTVSDGMVVAV